VLRDALLRTGRANFHIDLLPDMAPERVLAEVRHPRGSRSLSSHLKSRLHLDGIKAAVLRECVPKATFDDALALAAAIKAVPIALGASRPLDEAISSAGGVRFEGLTEDLMLKQLPGVFCAGEMLDWEAPTGGYLLSASLTTGYRAARGVMNYLRAV
jgi:predicted flavoprotein YhiN